MDSLSLHVLGHDMLKLTTAITKAKVNQCKQNHDHNNYNVLHKMLSENTASYRRFPKIVQRFLEIFWKFPKGQQILNCYINCHIPSCVLTGSLFLKCLRSFRRQAFSESEVNTDLQHTLNRIHSGGGKTNWGCLCRGSTPYPFKYICWPKWNPFKTPTCIKGKFREGSNRACPLPFPFYS